MNFCLLITNAKTGNSRLLETWTDFPEIDEVNGVIDKAVADMPELSDVKLAWFIRDPVPTGICQTQVQLVMVDRIASLLNPTVEQILLLEKLTIEIVDATVKSQEDFAVLQKMLKKLKED